MRQDRIEDRKIVIARKEEQKRKEKEVKKWEMLNRYKSDEVMKYYDENNKKKQWNKTLKYRQDLVEQMV